MKLNVQFIHIGAAVNMRPENDEYKLVFIQVLDDFIEDYRKDDIIAAF